MPALGRLFAPDPRDIDYLMQAVLPRFSTRSYRYWGDRWAWFDQGTRPICVGASWWHFLRDGPVRHGKLAGNLPQPETIYGEAQQVDEWPGAEPDYEGTSVRAGAKVLQSKGLISEYRWAMNLDDITLCLLEKGPVVVGFNWYASMNDVAGRPSDGKVKDISGPIRGGHAFVANGVNLNTGWIRFKNSWGKGLGDGGRFWMRLSDVERLLNEDGEAAIASEIPVRP